MPDSEQDEPENTLGNKLPPGMAEKMWKPGQSGNPGGRPKRKPLTDAYAALLDKPIPPDMARQLKLDESTTYAQVIAMSLVREAVKGKVQAAAEVADRVEGKITQPISGPDEGPIVVRSLNDFYAGLATKDDSKESVTNKSTKLNRRKQTKRSQKSAA